MPRCETCGFRVRGKNHKKGAAHATKYRMQGWPKHSIQVKDEKITVTNRVRPEFHPEA